MSNLSDFLATKNVGDTIYMTHWSNEYIKLTITKKSSQYIECSKNAVVPTKYTFNVNSGHLKGDKDSTERLCEISTEKVQEINLRRENKNKCIVAERKIMLKLDMNFITMEQIEAIDKILTPVEASVLAAV